MKATELRIGNLVMVEVKNGDYYDDYEGVVINIYNLHVLVEVVNEDGGVIHVTKHILSVRSIPLTEEWLLKFGFEKNNQSYQVVYTINVEDEYEQDYTSKLYLGLDGQYFIGIPYELFRGKSKIQYVHQLQNLYFALTGEELTLKK